MFNDFLSPYQILYIQKDEAVISWPLGISGLI